MINITQFEYNGICQQKQALNATVAKYVDDLGYTKNKDELSFPSSKDNEDFTIQWFYLSSRSICEKPPQKLVWTFTTVESYNKNDLKEW